MDTKRIENRVADLSSRSWFTYGLLFLIILLGAVLRFYKLGEWSFWIDEIYTINHAMRHFGNWELILDHIPPYRNWVPVSVILTAQALNIWGLSEWSARLASVVIGVTSIPILFFPTRRMFGDWVALLAVLLLAVSPWHIFWSQNARFYTGLLLFYTLALFALYFGIERNRPGYLLLFHLLVYLACSERQFAIFILPVVISYLLSLRFLSIEKPIGLNPKMILLLLAPFAVYGVFEILRWTWLGSSIVRDLMDEFLGQVNTTPLRLSLSIIYRIGIPLLLLGFSGGLYTLIKKQRASLLIFLGAMLPILLLVLVSPFMFAVDRYVFITLFCWFVLGALAIKELFVQAAGFVRIISFGVLLVLLMTSLSEVFLYYQYQHGNRPDWKGASLTVRQNMKAEDIVVVTRPELGMFYLRPDVTYINGVSSDTLENSSSRIWFVIDEATSPVNPHTKEWILQNTELIQVRETYLPGKNLSIYIYLYDPVRKSRTWSPDRFGSKGGALPQITCVYRMIRMFA